VERIIVARLYKGKKGISPRGIYIQGVPEIRIVWGRTYFPKELKLLIKWGFYKKIFEKHQ